VIVTAANAIHQEGIKINDVMSPFPVHGIDEPLELEESQIDTAGFIFGLTGVSLFILFVTWITTIDYETIIGGKPFWAGPAYIPLFFEVTVLSASVGMVIVFFVRNRLTAIRPRPVLDPRATDDKFIMVFDTEGRSVEELRKIESLMKQHGASEVNAKSVQEW
jgi:hypothetical protein